MHVPRRAIVFTFALCLAAAAAGARAQVDVGALRTATEGVVRTWLAEEPPTELSWNWGEGVLVFGLLEGTRAGVLAREARAYVEQYLAYHQARGIRVFWSDKTTPALAVAELALRDNVTTYQPLLDQVVAYVMDEAPRTPSQGLIYHLGKAPIHWIPQLFPDLWVDSLFHWVPTLHRVAALTGDAAYTDEALYQLKGFLRNMQDPATGLVTHAYNDFPLDQQLPEFAEGAFWARGNGWVIAAVVDTLASLPRDHPDRPGLLERALRHEAALRARQTARGLYRTVLLDNTTYEETAGSALITYGLARGASLGLFGAEARTAAERGMNGLLTVLVYDGERVLVNGTSVGTGPRPNLYPLIPTEEQVTYGVGAWVMAARQFLSPERVPL
eukprot:Unigene5245_Nuclearia_a/m.16101 Unigene5245_Nuclearia_a/g.16101  ORF Unigene5245_Nuclearia_a/g.16101 Unigene5245_Nuclearia_a/m.16101 type:complete len:386 (+) Unigene5245_Nuclearia_a:1-1158(+)